MIVDMLELIKIANNIGIVRNCPSGMPDSPEISVASDCDVFPGEITLRFWLPKSAYQFFAHVDPESGKISSFNFGFEDDDAISEKLEEAMTLLRILYDYSNPPTRMKNYDAYADAIQRTRVLLADWRKAHGNG